MHLGVAEHELGRVELPERGGGHAHPLGLPPCERALRLPEEDRLDHESQPLGGCDDLPMPVHGQRHVGRPDVDDHPRGMCLDARAEVGVGECRRR